MVRGPRYKYTHYLKGNGEELYDIKKTRVKEKILPRTLNTLKYSPSTVLC